MCSEQGVSRTGFKAHMEYEECMANNEDIVIKQFNTTVGVTWLENKTIMLSNGTNVTIPELEKCDLQETLKNVSKSSIILVSSSLFKPFTLYFSIYLVLRVSF